MTSKFVKTPKKSAIFDRMLLDGHKVSFHNFSILLKESNPFKLQLKESLLISRDKPILNKMFTPFPWNCLIDYDILLDIYYFLICPQKFSVKNLCRV